MCASPFRGPVLCSLYAAFLLGSGAPAALAQQEIFVTNTFSDSVTVYSRTGSGNLAPKRSLIGAATGLNDPSGVAVDEVNNELLVANNGVPNSITVYLRTASGNAMPLRTITGNLTGLNGVRGLSVDVVNNRIAVVNRAGGTVTVYLRTANGNVAPLQTISGGATGLSNPTGVFVDTLNNELLAASNGGALTVYLRTADGNATPLRKISGLTNTGFNNGPIGVAVDTVNNELAVTNPFFGAGFLPSVLVFARTADGDVASSRQIFGANTLLVSPVGLAVDPVNNEILVANSGSNSVRVYARATPGNVAPLRSIVGAATLLNSPQFLAVTTSPSATLDIDDNGLVEPLTDGLLVLRSFFGFTGATLTSGAIGGGCGRCDAAAIVPYIGGLGLVLDIDGNGTLGALTDGLLALRYLFGFRGATLISGAVGSGSTRSTAPTIEAYLAGLTS